jgi:hypothetical protein
MWECFCDVSNGNVQMGESECALTCCFQGDWLSEDDDDGGDS